MNNPITICGLTANRTTIHRLYGLNSWTTLIYHLIAFCCSIAFAHTIRELNTDRTHYCDWRRLSISTSLNTFHSVIERPWKTFFEKFFIKLSSWKLLFRKLLYSKFYNLLISRRKYVTYSRSTSDSIQEISKLCTRSTSDFVRRKSSFNLCKNELLYFWRKIYKII